MNPLSNNVVNVALVLILVVAMWAGLFVIVTHLPKGATYDCSIAEISPDMPLEAKQACRKLRMIKE